MRRSDVGPWLAVVLGGLLSVPLGRAAIRVLRPEAPPAATAEPCAVGFELHSNPGEWSVIGRYRGRATLGPKGLAIDLLEGAVQAEGSADVRGVVFGLAQASPDGAWSVTHSAEPIPVGSLEPGVIRAVRPSRPFIPGVTAADLEGGWLVAEHVLDATDAPGGTAWTYVHADRGALRPLLEGACVDAL